MAATLTFSKAESFKQMTKIVLTDIGVALALLHLCERFPPITHGPVLKTQPLGLASAYFPSSNFPIPISD